MARTDPQFMLRMPSDLKAQVEEAAREAGRSINAEIVHRLAVSLSGANFTIASPMLDTIAAAAKRNGVSLADEVSNRLFVAHHVSDMPGTVLTALSHLAANAQLLVASLPPEVLHTELEQLPFAKVRKATRDDVEGASASTQGASTDEGTNQPAAIDGRPSPRRRARAK